MANYNLTIYPDSPRKNRIKLLTGQRFGRLLVFAFAGTNNGAAMWHCLCSCGNTKTLAANALREKKSQSCGCLQAESRHTNRLTHGHGGNHQSPEYAAYNHAKGRCNTPTDAAYPRYGDRGIEFRFASFPEFLECVGYKPTPQHTLERIDNNGHYEKTNVIWATRQEQSRNRRNCQPITALGQSLLASEWGEQGYDAVLLATRRKRGWCGECTITLPKFHKCPHIGQPT